MRAQLRLADQTHRTDEDTRLNEVFSALADPIRRAILGRLDGRDLLVSELAEPFAISLQAVSKHIQVLVRAGLVSQERTGRISRCRLGVGPIFDAAVWLNRYSKYWQDQFNLLAVTLEDIERRRNAKPPPARRRVPRRGAGPRRKVP
ncbi:MAG TPA: metalloregulator ArsR/SmtB family transcription factor [Xanthobacteraceae bacterium]|jgi:DNA-binding transcriptional ArsR family regulator